MVGEGGSGAEAIIVVIELPAGGAVLIIGDFCLGNFKLLAGKDFSIGPIVCGNPVFVLL